MSTVARRDHKAAAHCAKPPLLLIAHARGTVLDDDWDVAAVMQGCATCLAWPVASTLPACILWGMQWDGTHPPECVRPRPKVQVVCGQLSLDPHEGGPQLRNLIATAPNHPRPAAAGFPGFECLFPTCVAHTKVLESPFKRIDTCVARR